MDQFQQSMSSPFWGSREEDEPHPTPWSLHNLFETKHEVAFGAAVLPLTTPYRNIFYCGPEALPGLGLEGSALVAQWTTQLVAEKSKLKKIL